MDFFKRINQFVGQVTEILDEEARKHIELGASLLDHGDFVAARHELFLVLQKYPTHSQALYFIGLCYYRQRPNDVEKACDFLEQARMQDPKNIDILFALGQCYQAQHKYKETIESYEQALRLQPDLGIRGRIEKALGHAFLNQRDGLQAVRELRKAFAKQPEDLELAVLLGQALFQKALQSPFGFSASGLAEIERIYQLALEKNDKDPMAWIGLGEVFLKQNKSNESIRMLQQAAARFPTHIPVLMALGNVLFVSVNKPGEEILQRALDLQNIAEKALKQIELQEKTNSSATHKNPDKADIYQYLAKAYDLLSSPAQALKNYTAAMQELDPAHAERQTNLLLNACISACRNHFFQETVFSLAQQDLIVHHPLAVAVQAHHPSVSFQHGSSLLLKAWDDSKDQSISPATIAIGLAIAWFFYKNKDIEQAIDWLNQIKHITPDESVPDQWIGTFYSESDQSLAQGWDGLLAAAETIFQRIPELNSHLPIVRKLAANASVPLKLGVLGEFNAGKSTLINALLGEDIAPTGVTPTTSVLCVYEYATTRKGHLVFADGSKQTLSFEEAKQALLHPSAQVQYIHIGLPIDWLQKINLIDTPGFNALDQSHEQTTTHFLQEAEAFLWVFSMDQAGKATEQSVLKALEQFGATTTLGVLNKIDRLSQNSNSPEQATEMLRQVISHLKDKNEGVGTFIKDVIPFGGRDAWLGKKYNDLEYLKKSNLDELRTKIEELFIANSAAIKQSILSKKFLHLLSVAQEETKSLLALYQSPQLDVLAALQQVDAKHTSLQQSIWPEARRAFIARLVHMQKKLSNDLFLFLKPRKWFLSDNNWAPADKEFVRDHIEQNLHHLIQSTFQNVLMQLHSPESQTAFLQSIQSYFAFVRGSLNQDHLENLLSKRLKFEVSEPALLRILEQELPTSLEILETELFVPIQAVLQAYKEQELELPHHIWKLSAWQHTLQKARLTTSLDALYEKAKDIQS